jgi:phospholipase D3/4
MALVCTILKFFHVILIELLMSRLKNLISHWRFPKHLSTNYNAKTPLKIYNPSDETVYKVYLGSSPHRLCADGRTDDLTAILSLIDSAEKFIYIAVGEYIPMDLFKNNEMWTVIDERLRAGSNKIQRVLGFILQRPVNCSGS